MNTFMYATSTHMYTQMHTGMAHMYAYIHHIHTLICKGTHTSIHLYLNICAHSWSKDMRTLTHPHTCIFIYAHMHNVCTCRYIHLLIHIHAYMHTWPQTCMLTYVHMHGSYAYICIHKQNIKVRVCENLLIAGVTGLCH